MFLELKKKLELDRSELLEQLAKSGISTSEFYQEVKKIDFALQHVSAAAKTEVMNEAVEKKEFAQRVKTAYSNDEKLKIEVQNFLLGMDDASQLEQVPEAFSIYIALLGDLNELKNEYDIIDDYDTKTTLQARINSKEAELKQRKAFLLQALKNDNLI
jgi:hypothetical protein